MFFNSRDEAEWTKSCTYQGVKYCARRVWLRPARHSRGLRAPLRSSGHLSLSLDDTDTRSISAGKKGGVRRCR